MDLLYSYKFVFGKKRVKTEPEVEFVMDKLLLFSTPAPIGRKPYGDGAHTKHIA